MFTCKSDLNGSMYALCVVLYLICMFHYVSAVHAFSHRSKSNSHALHLALIVGQNKGGPTVAPLQFAETDAQRVARLLRELGSYKKREVRLLLAPNRRHFRHVLQSIQKRFQNAPKGGSFLFYYSGHAKPSHFMFGNETISFSEVIRFVRKLPVRLRFVIIDSCYSGSIVYAKGKTRAKGLQWKRTIQWKAKKKRFPKQLKGFAILTSSGATDRSFESDRLKSSFFTSSLLSGLRGAADQNSDHRISLSELRSYVYQQTLLHSSRHKTPIQRPSSSITLEGGQHVYLAHLGKAESRVILRQNVKGHVFFFRKGQLIYELSKRTRQKMVFGVRAGSYQIQVRYRGWVGFQNTRLFVRRNHTFDHQAFVWKRLHQTAQARGLQGLNELTQPYSFGLSALFNYAPVTHLNWHSIGGSLQLDCTPWLRIGLHYLGSHASQSLETVHDIGLYAALGHGFDWSQWSLWLGGRVQPHTLIRLSHPISSTLFTNFGLALGAQVQLDFHLSPQWAIRVDIQGGIDAIFFQATTDVKPFFETGVGLLWQL